jgi:hypothetical protein
MHDLEVPGQGRPGAGLSAAGGGGRPSGEEVSMKAPAAGVVREAADAASFV